MTASPAADDRLVVLLRRSREAGVTLFDVAEARFPARAERLIARAFPEPDPAVSVIEGRSLELLAKERSPGDATPDLLDLSAVLRASLDRSRTRLSPVPVSIVEWALPGSATSSDHERSGVGLRDVDLGLGTALALRIPPVSQFSPGPPTASLYSVEFSLLEPEVLPGVTELHADEGFSFIVRNPFADGRLDGSRFASSTGPASPGAGPVDVRRLRAEFDPVLRLGFLTDGHRRTLAQAALAFVLGWPAVLTAVAPLPPPERLEEVLGYGSRPPLSEEELARVAFVK